MKNFKNVFSFCELSTQDYDALLIGWAKQNVQWWQDFDAGLSEYTPGGNAEAARTKLIREKHWTISDGGTVSVPSSLETITTVAGNPCPICFEVAFRWKTTPCKHAFGVTCLERWTERGNGTCPICRRGIIARGWNRPSHQCVPKARATLCVAFEYSVNILYPSQKNGVSYILLPTPPRATTVPHFQCKYG